MDIITWNINGLQSSVAHGFMDFLAKEKPDILCLQEVKVSADKQTKDLQMIGKYKSYWSFAGRPGYSGVTIYTKTEPKKVDYGFGLKRFDGEGRFVTAQYRDFDLWAIYFPHSSRDLSRLDFKLDFCQYVYDRLKKRDKKRSLILCGDINIAHKPIDLANPKQNEKNPGFRPEERTWMDKYLDFGLVDVFRHLYPDTQKFTWWSNMRDVRARDIGWRIDYFLVTKDLLPKVKNVEIMTSVLGSDHCPVKLVLKRGIS